MFKIFIFVVSLAGVALPEHKDLIRLTVPYQTLAQCDQARHEDAFKEALAYMQTVISAQSKQDVKLDSECRPLTNPGTK